MSLILAVDDRPINRQFLVALLGVYPLCLGSTIN